jgi:hypothetical protein
MMLDPIQIVQDVEALLDSHYTALVESLSHPQMPLPVTHQSAPAVPQTTALKPTGVTELLGNLAFLFVLSVLDQSMTRAAAR